MAAEEEAVGAAEESEGSPAIEQGTYEIIRDRPDVHKGWIEAELDGVGSTVVVIVEVLVIEDPVTVVKVKLNCPTSQPWISIVDPISVHVFKFIAADTECILLQKMKAI